MIWKAFLSLAVILGGGYLGMIYASRFECRARQLEEFRCALGQLEFDIRFLNLPLAESLEKTAAGQTGTVRSIFGTAAEELKRRRGTSVSDAWRTAVEKHRSGLCLSPHDLRILTAFSDSLGGGDTESEIGNIKAAQMRLRVEEDAARAQAQKNGKLYRGLGLLAGIFAVVVLF